VLPFSSSERKSLCVYDFERQAAEVFGLQELMLHILRISTILFLNFSEAAARARRRPRFFSRAAIT
jgi:hypothetical protein